MKKNGDSTLVRGMEIQLLKDGTVTSSRLTQEFESYLGRLRFIISDDEQKLKVESAEQDKMMRDFPGITRTTIMEDYYRSEIASIKELLQVRQPELTTIKPTETVLSYYKHVRSASSYFGPPDVSVLAQTFGVATTHADSEGHYRFENVPVGNYFLLADFDSAYSRVQWFVPVSIATSGEVSVDLFNDNAEVIVNKPQP